MPETACGACGSGKWKCSTSKEPVCEGVTTNACGGCGSLPQALGSACDGDDADTCLDDTYECSGSDAVVCSKSTDACTSKECLELVIHISTDKDLQDLAARGCTTIKALHLVGEGITSVLPLAKITTISYSLRIGGVPNLSSLEGLHALTRVDNLGIVQMPALHDLSGLRNLERVGFALTLQDTGVHDLNGLAKLGEINGDVLIADNAQLTDVKGLASLSALQGSLTIRDNTLLRTGCARALADALTAKGALATAATISGNAVGNDCP